MQFLIKSFRLPRNAHREYLHAIQWRSFVFCLCLAGFPGLASSAISSLDLEDYSHVITVRIARASVTEASGLTYNYDTGSLYVVSDEAYGVIEISTDGLVIGSMSLENFSDIEGVTYIGGGQIVLVEERTRDAHLISYVDDGSADRDSVPSVDLGSSTGNNGIEGISYDPVTGLFLTVKEFSPQEVNQNSIAFNTGNATVSSLFSPALGVSDLSGIQALSAVPSLVGTSDESNLLILSHEDHVLLEVSRTGEVLSTFDLVGLTSQPEGVAIDYDGNIYLVDENVLDGDSALLVLSRSEPGIDSDGDGVIDEIDNCPEIENADQADADDDGIGNVCDPDFDPLMLGTTYAPEVGVKNQFYWWSGLSASGGVPPYTYSLVGGWLPWPLTLNVETGVITGMAWNVVTAYFTIQVTDANSDTVTLQSQITVNQSANVCSSCHSVEGF
jgi:hypothetical protein